MSAPVLSWQRRAAESGSRKEWPTEPSEETRQHYATVCVHQFQLTQSKLSFSEILHAFRYFGEQYDLGYRLRDKEFAA